MLPLFFGFFTVKSLELFTTGKRRVKGQRPDKDLPVSGLKRASDGNRRPVLTSETTKRKNSNIFDVR
jgi:hypothetical protein